MTRDATTDPTTLALATVTDAHYLPRAVVLARSLARHASGTPLLVACLDGRSARALDGLRLPGVEARAPDALRSARAALDEARLRLPAWAYARAAKPFACLDALAAAGAEAVLYLDADVELYRDPLEALRELGDGSVLVTPHHLPGEVTPPRTHVNAGVVGFRADRAGRAAIETWADALLSAADAYRDGRFSDQDLLNRVLPGFAGVRSLEHPGVLSAWNGGRRAVRRDGGALLVEGRPLLLFHFASLRLYRGPAALRRLGLFPRRLRLLEGRPPLVWQARFPIPPLELREIWQPYLERYRRAVADLRAVDPSLPDGSEPLGLAHVRRHAARVVAERKR